MELSENTRINDNIIEQINNKQSPSELIHILSPVKLKTLKTYIKTNLKTGFIQPSKSFTNAFILFNKKSDDNFCLYSNYQSLNNLMIKNRYSFPLIGKTLNQLDWAKRFIQLNLISIYHKMRI